MKAKLFLPFLALAMTISAGAVNLSTEQIAPEQSLAVTEESVAVSASENTEVSTEETAGEIEIAADIVESEDEDEKASTLYSVEAGHISLRPAYYAASDEDLLSAEAEYAAMEAQLEFKIENFEILNPGYDEYVYDVDELGHDPYVLLSLLSAYMGGYWTIDTIDEALETIFNAQYTLTITSEGGVCTVTLSAKKLSRVPSELLTRSELAEYASYMSILGGTEELFPESEYQKYISGSYTVYVVLERYLEDEFFAAIIEEAEQYLGYPYVWGGSYADTSFDCSGFVCNALSAAGVQLERMNAQGLYDMSESVSYEELQPGDLVFFTNTYESDYTVTHVGIYVGDGVMIHAGDPVQYALLDGEYWSSHLYGYGRIRP